MENCVFNENFCENVRYLRCLNRLTQREMAAILGISVGKLHRIENGEANCRIHTGMVDRLCSRFGLGLSDVLETSLWQRNWGLSQRFP